MTDIVFDLMQCFPGSVIKPCGEIILDSKQRMSFTVKGLETREEVVYKLLEWCSRPIAKENPYSNDSRNREWRRSLLYGYNQFLNTHFSENDMYWIYDQLGNGISRERTIKFVDSGFSMEFLLEERKK